MKHFTLESENLHSVPGRNVVNSQTFYFSISETILKHFYRNFVQRHSVIRALYSFYSLFLQLSYIRHIFHTFHSTPPLHLYIQHTRNIFSSLMMTLIGRNLDFGFYFLNSGLRPHQNSLYFCIMLLQENMNRL